MDQVNQIMETRRSPTWLSDIERLKGLAILLVVWAHSFQLDFPESALALRQAIYEFHMPLFMFLSGYVFIYSDGHRLKGGFAKYTEKRLMRILLPFFVMAAIIIAGKVVFQNFMSVGKPVTDISTSLRSLFIGTESSPVLFIWYLAVLFVQNIITAVLFERFGIPIFVMFVFAILLYFLYIYFFYNNIKIDYFYLNRIMMHYPAFLAGCLARIHHREWGRLVDAYWVPSMIIFVFLDIILFSTEWRYLVVGFAAAPAFHGMIRSSLFKNSSSLQFLGSYAFAIYLLNMPFIGFSTGVLKSFLPTYEYGYVIIIVATVFGVAGPIAIRATLKKFRLSQPIANAMA